VSISFLLDHHHHLVRTTFLGIIPLIDLVIYVRSLATQGLLRYPQLIDAREATLRLTAPELREIAGLMTSLRAMFGKAPVAFVPGDAGSYGVVQQYWEMGAGGTELAVFEDVGAAEVWIEIGRSSGTSHAWSPAHARARDAVASRTASPGPSRNLLDVPR
jgi:hypothetical protein